MTIEPLIGGLIHFFINTLLVLNYLSIEPLIGGLTRPCGNEELEMSNQQLSFSVEQGKQVCI